MFIVADVVSLSESKLRNSPMFFHRYPESYTPFPSPHFPPSNDARISLKKLLTSSTDSVTKILVAKIKPEL